MKKIILLIILNLALYVNGQNRGEIISLINQYSEDVEELDYDLNFIETKLNPAILKVEKMTCENNDIELFDHLLDMAIKTKDTSRNSAHINVIAGVFTCKPELVEKKVKEKDKDDYLISSLWLGFMELKKEEIENYEELADRLSLLSE